MYNNNLHEDINKISDRIANNDDNYNETCYILKTHNDMILHSKV